MGKKNNRIGETRVMNCGLKATIIRYNNYVDIDIKYEDGTIVKDKRYDHFKEGEISHPFLKKHKKGKITTDHLGNVFDSEMEMCKFHNVNYSTYKTRIYDGLSIKDALISPIAPSSQAKKCTDHLGNEFNSIKEMCDYWNINLNTYNRRIKLGWILKKILTTPIITEPRGHKCVDHLGQKFNSIKEMCNHWNINPTTFKNRIKQNYSIEEALTTQLNTYECVDHLGNKFNSIKDMCNFYNITYELFNARFNKNKLSLEETLTIPKHMSLGEYRIKESLERRQIKYKYNKTLKTIFKEFKLDVSWEEFLDVLYDDLILKGITTWSKETIGKLKPDFVLYKDKNNKIIGIIEFDGEQHFGLIEHFIKTVQQFIYRCDCDVAKNKFFEFMLLPLLRIRYDQVDLIEPILDDFLAHPEEYISKKHNPYLTEEEYWAELNNNLKELNNDDNLGINPA